MFIKSIYCFFLLHFFENSIVHGLTIEESRTQRITFMNVKILQDTSISKDTDLSDVLSTYSVDTVDVEKSIKVPINNIIHETKLNTTSDLKFKSQNIILTAMNSNITDMNAESNENSTAKEDTPHKSTVITEVSVSKLIPEIITDDVKMVTSLYNQETTTSDITTDISNEKSSVISSFLSETTSTYFDNLTSIIDSTTKIISPSSTEEVETMSSGIIALVMAIVFAIVVIIVYISLLIWRRYLEYRYGNRELLVNDLEFDTNDLRHFEL